MTLVNSSRIIYEMPEYVNSSPLNIEQKIIKIENWNIYYVKVGRGPHHVLCVPGGFGTIKTDFIPILEEFDLEKFTIVAFDSPGFGRSTPSGRSYLKDFYYSDADIIDKLMKGLCIAKYSLMGWCYGGIVSLIHAAKRPEAIKKLVVWGAQSFILPNEFDDYEIIKDVSHIYKQANTRIQEFGAEKTGKYWQELLDSMTAEYKPKGGEICSGLLKDISCPTFILHGAKDGIVDKSHATYLQSHIRNSRAYIYPDGKHNISMRYHEDFNRRVQEFLLE